MFNICRRMMGSREAGEDVLQNAFVTVYRKLHTFKGESALGAWIKRIVVNHCIDALKRKKVQWVEATENLAQDPVEDVDTYFDQDDVYRVKQAIQRLPEGYKVVFTLYLMEGYDHGEIAQILGITEGASKSQYSRAKKKLHQILREKSKVG